MKIIGLTGNMGCGKSTVAGMLERHGVATIDADAVTREIRDTDAGARDEIARRFGTLVPADLSSLVFTDAAALRDLEAILHPRVRDAVLQRLEALGGQGVEIVVVEAIKLLKSPLRARCDSVWVVTCREEDAVARLAAERRLGVDDVRARLANQSAQSEKVAAADVVIDGSAPLAVTRAEVERALAALRGPTS